MILTMLGKSGALARRAAAALGLPNPGEVRAMRREIPEFMRLSGQTGASVALSALLAGMGLGCAAGPGYGEYLMRWQGKNIAELQADWGKPDHRYNDHLGRETLQYAYHEVIFESLSSGRRIVWWCLSDFHLGRDGRVVEATSTGNHCFPPENLAAERARQRSRGALPSDLPPADSTH